MGLKIKITKKSTYEKLFYFLWALYGITFCLMQQTEFYYMFDTYNARQFIYYIITFGLFGMLLFNKYTGKQFIIYLLVGVFFAISLLKLHNLYLIILIEFIITGAKIDVKKLVRFDIKVKILLTIFVVSLCLLGFIDNYTAVINGASKQALGFSHPNVFTAYVLTILLEWLYLRYEKLRWFDVVGIVAIIYVVSNISMGRSSLYTFAVVLIIALFLKVFPKIIEFKIIQYLWALLPTICTILSFVIVRLYEKGNAIALVINEITTRRILQAYRLLDAYGISIFGQTVDTYGTRAAATSTAEFFSVDMSYIILPINYGVVILIFLCVTYFFLTMKTLKEKNIGFAICILYFVIFGLAESYFYRIAYNFTMVALLSFVGSRTASRKKKVKLKG